MKVGCHEYHDQKIIAQSEKQQNQSINQSINRSNPKWPPMIDRQIDSCVDSFKRFAFIRPTHMVGHAAISRRVLPDLASLAVPTPFTKKSVRCEKFTEADVFIQSPTVE